VAIKNVKGVALSWLLGATVVSSTVTSLDAAEKLDEAIRRARVLNHPLVVILYGPGTDGNWAERVRRAEWIQSMQPDTHLFLQVEQNSSATLRLGVKEFPQVVVLDGEGREIGRLRGKQPVPVLGRKLSRLLEASERFLNATGRLDRADAEALLWQGKYRWNRGDRLRALASFRKVVDIAAVSSAENPQTVAEALCYIGQNALDCGDYREAEKNYRRALDKVAGGEVDWSSALGLSMSLRRQQRIEEAIVVLENCVSSPRAPAEMAPTAQALFTLGYLHHEMGNRGPASRHFTACNERFPGSLYGQRAIRYLARPLKKSRSARE
jgi:TolA-binding protein